MKILVTGANSNVGRGMIPRLVRAGHELVLTDLTPPVPSAPAHELPFHQMDIQIGFGLDRIALECDAILHLPAWHGIHSNSKTETDYWRLNVDGTFWMFEAARVAGVRRVAFLSSQAWHGHYNKYGFTKRIGEEMCEYNRHQHGISYVAIRPSDFTPWSSFTDQYGPRLLAGGVDREDVLNCIGLSLDWLERCGSDAKGGHVDAVRQDPYTESDLAGWEMDSPGILESIFPGARDILERYGITITAKPMVSCPEPDSLGEEIGFRPTRHFGTFLKELHLLDKTIGPDGIRAKTCDY